MTTILNNVASNGIKALANPKLFTPLKLGSLNLKHRIIMSPLTRVRSPEHIPDENVVEYYRQRASDGGLQITEATHISVMVSFSHAETLEISIFLVLEAYYLCRGGTITTFRESSLRSKFALGKR